MSYELGVMNYEVFLVLPAKIGKISRLDNSPQGLRGITLLIAGSQTYIPFLSLCILYVIDELPKDIVTTYRLAVSRYYQLFPCPRQRHVQFTVDGHAVFLEAVGGEEIELIGVLDSERIDDDITLRALIPLHGVDGDLLQRWNTQRLYLTAYHCYLVAVGYDDAHCLLR